MFSLLLFPKIFFCLVVLLLFPEIFACFVFFTVIKIFFLFPEIYVCFTVTEIFVCVVCFLLFLGTFVCFVFLTVSQDICLLLLFCSCYPRYLSVLSSVSFFLHIFSWSMNLNHEPPPISSNSGFRHIVLLLYAGKIFARPIVSQDLP